MILRYLDIHTIQTKCWYLAEISECPEPILHRIVASIAGIFADHPVELFIPIAKRDLDVFTLSTTNWIYVRSDYRAGLLRLKQLTGITGLLTAKGSGYAADIIGVDDSYVQELIERSRAGYEARHAGIEVGSFVRILDSSIRDYCGTVTSLENGRATIKLTLRTKDVIVNSPVGNLLNLSHVPSERRVFFYGELAADVSPDLLRPYLEGQRPAPPEPEKGYKPSATNKKYRPGPEVISHRNTATAIAKKAAQSQPDPNLIAKEIFKRLVKGDIKVPKSLFVLFNLVKASWRPYAGLAPDETLHELCKRYKFSLHNLTKQARAMGIELQARTPSDQIRRMTKKKDKRPEDLCADCQHPRGRHKHVKSGQMTRCFDCHCQRFYERGVNK